MRARRQQATRCGRPKHKDHHQQHQHWHKFRPGAKACAGRESGEGYSRGVAGREGHAGVQWGVAEEAGQVGCGVEPLGLLTKNTANV